MTPPLVSATWLLEHANDANLRIIDLRWYLGAKRGQDEYEAGHIAGSVFLDLGAITAPAGPGRHPLPDTRLQQLQLRTLGIDTTSHVVVVDDAGGSVAARLWFLLRAHGHDAVSVLDGGLQAWTRAGGSMSTGAPTLRRGNMVLGPRADLIVDKRVVQARSTGTLLLDVRAAERYRGDVEPVDARPGHIPGAVNAPWAGNLTAEGTFASPEVLRARYSRLGADVRPVIVSCGSGVTACHTVLAMSIAGLPAPKLYEGSYSDWARDTTLPVALGSELG